MGQHKRLPNHSQRKKNRYARCQELFNNCPKKLAEAAVLGNLSIQTERKEPPKKDSITQLYGALWGTKGPVLGAVSAPKPISMNTAFEPITIEEVKARITKTNNQSAAQLDGVKKVHLGKPGIPETLTIIYNIIIAEKAFPKIWKSNRTTLIPKPNKPVE